MQFANFKIPINYGWEENMPHNYHWPWNNLVTWDSTIDPTNPVKSREGARVVSQTSVTTEPNRCMTHSIVLTARSISRHPVLKRDISTTVGMFCEQEMMSSFPWDLFLLRNFWESEEISFTFRSSLCNQYHKFIEVALCSWHLCQYIDAFLRL